MANVLIVEDSKSAAAAQAYSLWELGHTVTFAYSAKEARRCFEQERHQVVLLDFDLPDGTGLEVFRALRSVDPEVCVVMVTGKGNECLAAQILKEGAKDYLPKSCELLGILPEVVDRVLREKQMQSQLAANEKALEEIKAELAATQAQLQEEIQNHLQTVQALEAATARVRQLET